MSDFLYASNHKLEIFGRKNIALNILNAYNRMKLNAMNCVVN